MICPDAVELQNGRSLLYIYIIYRYAIGTDNVRVGMFRYFNRIDTGSEIKLKDTTSLKNLLSAIENLESKYDPRRESGIERCLLRKLL